MDKDGFRAYMDDLFQFYGRNESVEDFKKARESKDYDSMVAIIAQLAVQAADATAIGLNQQIEEERFKTDAHKAFHIANSALMVLISNLAIFEVASGRTLNEAEKLSVRNSIKHVMEIVYKKYPQEYGRVATTFNEDPGTIELLNLIDLDLAEISGIAERRTWFAGIQKSRKK